MDSSKGPRMPTRFLSPVVLVTLTAAGVAQEPPFKSANQTVAVYATVIEVGGHLVPDLGRSDFQIIDNGRKQELTVFANDPQPITVVMMLDRSGSMRGNFQVVEQAAETFVEDLGPNDRARIGSFANRIQVDPREFTSDHDELRRILREELQEEGPTPLWNAVDVGITTLRHEQGRRVVLVFTDGVDSPGNEGAKNSTLKDVMKRAEEENVMVYAIGFASRGGPGLGGRGRGGPGGPSRGRPRPPVGWWPPGFDVQFGGFGGFGGQNGGAQGPDPGLAKLAEATGGGYFELTRTADLNSTFKRVVDELRHQYLLGFTPSKLDGKTHRLEVKVRDPFYTVRARTTYLAATGR
jgi:Ca-activated chloride channel family protein